MIGRLELHMHAERENVLLPRLPLANERIKTTNDGIRTASTTEVRWWISIHGPAHLGLRRPTGRRYWVCACAVCGYNKKQEFLDQETRVGEQVVGSDITTISTFTQRGHRDRIQKVEPELSSQANSLTPRTSNPDQGTLAPVTEGKGTLLGRLQTSM